MSNSHDFWDSTKGKFSSGVKRLKLPKFPLPKKYLDVWRSIISAFHSFFRRLVRLPKVLNRTDKIALLILFIILLGLLGYKFNRDWLSKTKKIPAVGGTYKEILIGDAQYLNPILAKTDTDKTINQLIYSGLTKLAADGNVVPDLAQSWEVSADGATYTFHLRDGVVWQDGAAFTSADVANTIAAIKDENIKSPYYDAWEDVVVETPDAVTVVFKLKGPYGPFIYNTLVGIIPAHMDSANISSAPVGTGPYKFTKAVSGNKKIQQVVIERSEVYYGQKPYISEIDFQVASDENQAQQMFDSWGVTAAAGIAVKQNKVANFSFPTSRYFGLIFNLNSEKFKDVNIRKKISVSARPSLDGKSADKFDPPLSFKMLVLDKPLSVSAATSLKNDYAGRGIEIIIDKKSAIDYSNLLEKRNFEAVFYGFDSGYDRDPYPFWHSSQIAVGENFAGFSNKQADLLLENARMTTDTASRNQKYDQFMTILNDQVPAIFLPAQTFDFSVKKGVQGIEKITGSEPYDHLNSIAEWYIRTKRVKP